MADWTGRIAVARESGDATDTLDGADLGAFDVLELSYEAHKDLDSIALWPMMELEVGVSLEMGEETVIEADEVEEFVEFLEGYVDHRGQDTTTAAGAAALTKLLALARSAQERENAVLIAF